MFELPQEKDAVNSKKLSKLIAQNNRSHVEYVADLLHSAFATLSANCHTSWYRESNAAGGKFHYFDKPLIEFSYQDCDLRSSIELTDEHIIHHCKHKSTKYEYTIKDIRALYYAVDEDNDIHISQLQNEEEYED